MKNFLLFFVAIASLSACKSNPKANLSLGQQDLLPKDVALKPKTEYSQQKKDEASLERMREEIKSLINKENCKDASRWRTSPMGAKACGGPAEYIAYPIKIESQILPKIKEYTEAQTAYNKKYGIVSDCMMVMPPSEIGCERGKPILKNRNP